MSDRTIIRACIDKCAAARDDAGADRMLQN
jgi:hypothetical protein